jgi:hypothetical protein
MATPQRHTFGWMLGHWLITLQVERVERAADTPADDEGFIDWDALADQYGIPVSAEGGGLQMCAKCRQSVVSGSGKFANRVLLGNIFARIEKAYSYPAGAYLCTECEGATPDDYPEMLYKDSFVSDYEDYEPSPYDGTYSEE